MGGKTGEKLPSQRTRPPTPGATEVKIGDSTFNVEGQK